MHLSWSFFIQHKIKITETAIVPLSTIALKTYHQKFDCKAHLLVWYESFDHAVPSISANPVHGFRNSNE